MGRRLKRGKKGNVAQYLTRTKAIRKLQLRLSEFRRLSILKGIHPREPKKKVHGANKTYYHIKDINWLMHEPLLHVFRNMKAHDKKVRKAYAKFNPELAERLRHLTPTYKLDHLVKERYPSFVDALRDLDDALTMMHLFATLPAEKRLSIPGKAVQVAQQLALEWNAWIVRTSSLRKVFVSVKGIYFQADVLGQSVTWLTPHQLAQVLPLDVDYKVMLTFLEFHQCLLRFVNFKLYHTLGLKYPPVLDPQSLEKEALALAGVMRELAGVRQEESAAADAAAAALQASDAAVVNTTKTANGTSAAAARLSQLDAVAIAALTGTEETGVTRAAVNGTGDGKNHAEETDEDEDDSEDGLSSIEPGSDDEDDHDQDDEAGGSEGMTGSEHERDEEEEKEELDGEEAVMQLAERRATGGLAQSRGDVAALNGDAVAGSALGLGVSSGDDDAAVCASLFKGMVFFLAREVPREPLALVVRAFGGVAAWDGEGSPHQASDEDITHHVVDRPTQSHKILSRHYIQPQWVFDCVNFRVLLPTDLYAPGKVCPPHLSPFVNDEDEGYTPDWAKQVKKLQEVAQAARDRASTLAVEGFAEDAARSADASDTTTQQAADDDVITAEIAHYRDLAKEMRGAEHHRDKRARGVGNGFSSLNEVRETANGEETDEEEEDEEDSDICDVRAGGPTDDIVEGGEPQVVESLLQQKADAAKVKQQGLMDEGLLKDVMMTRKNRKLYERINRAREGKRQRIEVLEERRAALQQQQQSQGKQDVKSLHKQGKRR